jgi:hypothetical protein
MYELHTSNGEVQPAPVPPDTGITGFQDYEMIRLKADGSALNPIGLNEHFWNHPKDPCDNIDCLTTSRAYHMGGGQQALPCSTRNSKP